MKNIADDGRSARAVRTRALLLDACVRLMCAGIFRPPMVRIAAMASRVRRSAFEHFKCVDRLYAEALEVPGVRRAILLHATAGDTRCLDWPESLQEAVVHALVFGAPLARQELEAA